MPETTILVPATVSLINPDGTMYLALEDGSAVKAPHAGQPQGDTVHVRLKPKNFVTLEVGAPGTLGLLTGAEPPPVIAAAAPRPAVALPPDPAMGEGYEGAPPPEHYVENPAYAEDFGLYFRLADAGITTRVIVSGAAGVGKTSQVIAECYKAGRIPFLLEGGRIYQPDDWFGRLDLGPEGTFFTPDPSVAAIESERAALIFDELNRVHTPRALNPITGLLSGTRTAYCHGLGRHIRMHPGAIVFATVNEGAEYTGTINIDEAIWNRFEFKLIMDYMPKAQEVRALVEATKVDKATAGSIVEFAWKLRELAKAGALPTAPSTRSLVAVGHAIAVGGIAPARAIEKVLIPPYERRDDEGAAKEVAANAWESMFAGQGGKSEPKPEL